MKVRPYETRDSERLKEITASVRDDGVYIDPEDGENVINLVLEVDGRVIGSMHGTVVMEAKMLMDQSYGNVSERLWAINRLWVSLATSAKALGMVEIHCPVAPWFEPFVKGLSRMKCFVRDFRARFVFDLRG